MANNEENKAVEGDRKLTEGSGDSTDEFEEILVVKSEEEQQALKQKEIDDMLAKMEAHPAFCEHVDLDNLSPEMEALMAIKYEGDNTPEEKADAYKDEGNFQFKYKRYRTAIENYTEAIRVRCKDKQLNAILYSNRAAANARLNNRRSAVRDCIASRKFSPNHMKAIIKGIECMVSLHDYDTAIKWCDEGLDIEPANEKIMKFRTEAENKKKVLERDRRRAKQKDRKAQEQDEMLMDVIKSHGCTLERGLTLSEVEPCHPGASRVSVDQEGLLHWPLLLLYPEHGETDLIQDAREDCSPYVFLEQVFSVTQPPAPWDQNRKYTPTSVQLWYEDKRTQRLYLVSRDRSLQQVLSSNTYVIVAGTPVFYAIVKDSPFSKHFLSQYSCS